MSFCKSDRCISFAAGIEPKLSAVEQHGLLRVEGISLIDKHGHPIALKGVSLGWHNWWPRFYDSQTVASLKKDWNVQVVRAAIGVHEDNAYLENPDFALERLFNVVEAAIENDIYVIVDWHSHKRYPEEAKAFFKKVATRYHQYPNIIYEIYNEPVDDSWEEVKAYAEDVIRSIREIDTKNVILVGCPQYDQDIQLVADNPISGQENIMYTVHFYAATHGQWLRERAEYALSKGIPLFISECAGMEASGDGPINRKEWDTWVVWMAKHRLSWTAWSLSDKNETCSMIRDTDAPIHSWKDEDLKEWGKVVRDEICPPHITLPCIIR